VEVMQWQGRGGKHEKRLILAAGKREKVVFFSRERDYPAHFTREGRKIQAHPREEERLELGGKKRNN